MKNKILSLVLVLLLVGALVVPAAAETYHGSNNWSVVFTPEKELVSTFSSSELSEAISGMQPGDNIVFQ